MSQEKNDQLTIEDKLEIRRLYRTKEMTQDQIGEKFQRSRVTINKICNDETLDDLEIKAIEKEGKFTMKDFVKKLESIQQKVVKRIEAVLDDGESDLRKLTPLLKELNNHLQVLRGRPTSINETRKLSLDVNEVLKLSPEQRADYLIGKKYEDVIDIPNESSGKIQS